MKIERKIEIIKKVLGKTQYVLEYDIKIDYSVHITLNQNDHYNISVLFTTDPGFHFAALAQIAGLLHHRLSKRMAMYLGVQFLFCYSAGM